MKTNLVGKHILVTGGSRGIGHAIVSTFLAEGANVSYCSRNATGDEFTDVAGQSSLALAVGSQVDIADAAALEQWVKSSAERFGRIDHVVANASPVIHSPDRASWTASFQADILGLVTLVDASTPHLAATAAAAEKSHQPPTTLAHSDASITVISSMAGWIRNAPVIGSPYTAFKHAQAVIARDYQRKLGPLGIRINAVVPSLVLVESMGVTEEVLDDYLDMLPLRRVAMPQDIANTVVFLSCELSRITTGAVVHMDSGMNMSL